MMIQKIICEHVMTSNGLEGILRNKKVIVELTLIVRKTLHLFTPSLKKNNAIRVLLRVSKTIESLEVFDKRREYSSSVDMKKPHNGCYCILFLSLPFFLYLCIIFVCLV